jgi:hypothetical protein
MMDTHKIGISLSVIGVVSILMVVTAPTLENHQAIAVTQPVIKKYPVRKAISGYRHYKGNITVIITSPNKGQQVPISKNLIISGISSANRTNNCEVSVIINNIKPYQKTNATGHNGSNDYSTWVYHLGFPYPPLKLGENKITAKIMCAGSSHARFNTVNITGVQ